MENKKVYVDNQSDKRFPYRVRCQGKTVSVLTKDEAVRIKKYTEKVIALLSGL